MPPNSHSPTSSSSPTAGRGPVSSPSIPLSSTSSPYFPRPTPAASSFSSDSFNDFDDEAPTLASLFGDARRGMTTVIDTSTLSPSKSPSKRPSATTDSSSSSSSPFLASSSSSFAHSSPASPLKPAPGSSSRASSAASHDVIDLADDGDDVIAIPSSPPPPAPLQPPLPSLSAAAAFSERQLASLISHAPKPKSKRYRSAKSDILKVYIQLISPTLIAVTSTPRDDRVTSIVQGISGAAYDEKLSQWTCRLSALSALKARLLSLRGEHLDVEIDTPDDRLIQGEGQSGGDAADESKGKEEDGQQFEWMKRIPRKLGRQLFPFQRLGVDYVLQHEGRALIGDEMGLGKTLQSLAIAACYYDEWPVLIVCPSSLRYNWRNEIQRWLPNVGYRQIQTIMSGKDRLLHRGLNFRTSFCIISYDLVYKFEVSLRKANFQVVIADESHYIKSDNAKRTKALLPVLKKAKRCILLSGTPALSRPIELFTQVSALTDVFGSLHDFGMRYAQGKKGRWGWEYKGAHNLAELNFLLRKHVMIRRLKEDVLTQLMPKARTAVMVTVDNPEVERVCKRLTELRLMAEKMVGSSSAPTAGLLSGFSAETRATLFEMFAKTGLAKLSAVLQYLADMLQNGVKFLVFAHHLAVLDGIEAFLTKQNVNYFRLDGSTSAADRQAGVDRFQTDSRCRVALLSITAGGTGITLTAASTVVFAELQFTPALLLQAEDRVHRIGQPNAVNIHYLLGRHSLDDLLWPLLVKKLHVLGSTLDGEEDELEFQDVKGDPAASGVMFKKGNAMSDWLEKERARKAAEVRSREATEQRRKEKWKDAIEVDSDGEDGMQSSFPSASPSPPPLPSDTGEIDEDDVKDSMWVYVTDDEDDGFIVDDNEEPEVQEEEEEEVEDDEHEGKYDEEQEDDDDDRVLSDPDFQPDDTADDPVDEDEGEAEYGVALPPRKKQSRRRVIRSDGDEDEDEVVDDPHPFVQKKTKRPVTGRRTPSSPHRPAYTPSSTTSSSSSSSSASAARDSSSPWASVFGLNLHTIEEETARNHRKLTAAQRSAQRRAEEEKRSVEEAVDDDEGAVIAGGAAQEEKEVSDGLMSQRDLSVMLVGMDFEASRVRQVLAEMAKTAKRSKGGAAMIDINAAIEQLAASSPSADSRSPMPAENEVGEVVDDGVEVVEAEMGVEKGEDEAVPCERCSKAIPFFQYAAHVRGCRLSSAASSEGAKEERKEAEAEVQADDVEVEEEQPLKSRLRKRTRVLDEVDLEDEERKEGAVVLNEDNSVDDVSAVEWIEG